MKSPLPYKDLIFSLSPQSFRKQREQDVPQQFGYRVWADTIAPPCVHGHVNDCPAGDHLPSCIRRVPHHTPWHNLWPSAESQYTTTPSPNRTSSRHPTQSFLPLGCRQSSRSREWKLLQRAATLSRSKCCRGKASWSLCSILHLTATCL